MNKLRSYELTALLKFYSGLSSSSCEYYADRILEIAKALKASLKEQK